ncbi:hypothetical protein F4802DRAFT_550192 [Xylaria palmicola]|nr:hypothetical protein F4802DRAFT_550192 [Xylaria palmicola]
MASGSGSPRISPVSLEIPVPSPDAMSRSRPVAAPTSKPASAVDPVLRNALRYTISAREYETLHKYVISRSRILRKRAPTVSTVENYINGESNRRGSVGRDAARGKGKERAAPGSLGPRSGGGKGAGVGAGDSYNARAIRHALRVFVITGIGAKAYEMLLARIKGKGASSPQKKQPFYKSSPLRLSLSLSTILLLYRLLFRFFTRLRAQLLDPTAAPFRQRNPRTSNTLTSPYAPAVGAGLAGLALGIYPAEQLRLTIMISVMFRALEFGWNMFEDNGSIWGFRSRAGGNGMVKRERPWWFGSWMLQPLAMGQLLHATVFDRESAPAGFFNIVFKHTTTYLHGAPENLPAGLKWPNPWEIVDSLAQMAKLNWPPFISPTLFPDEPTLPATLTTLAPLTSQAYPIITSLSCASLHPGDPSCLRTYLTFWVRSFPRLGRFFLIFYSMLMLPRYKLLYNAPLHLLNRLLSKALRLTTFATGAMSTAWASICFFQTWLPRTFLPTQRFFLGGFLAGLWAFVERREGRSIFLYTARTSVDSLWKVGVKRRWWRAMRGGDVWLFALALAITGAVYERDARAIREANVRKGISWMRGTGFRDWGVEEEDELEQAGGVKEE